MKLSKRTSVIVGVAGGIVLVAVLGIVLVQNRNQTAQQAKADETKALFYGMLENAARQQKIHVGMYRETFDTKEHADAMRNPGTVMSSVAEVDTEEKAYRSVFATNEIFNPEFSVGRCIDGTTYNDYYSEGHPTNKAPRATTLPQAAGPEHLGMLPTGHLFKVTEPLQFISCPYLGLLPSSSLIAVSRLSDGVMPVTLSDAQAKRWAQAVMKADLFDIKDGGSANYKGKDVKKVSFSPRDETSINDRLYKIFYETAEIDKIKRELPDAQWQYEYLSLNIQNTGSVGGYYLVDDTAKLPVYSELYSTNPDKKSSKPGDPASKNIVRTKQSYEFPSKLTITLETPLEFLK
jgi:hypothetical protein